jgi:cytochrome c-type biogenesis protein CcmH
MSATRPLPARRGAPALAARLWRALSAPLAALLLVTAVLAPALGPAPAHAGEAAPAAEDPALEARMLKLTAELRCLVCQNQTIADSHAGLAVDLKNQVREMLRRGDSDAQILAYMTQRYGDFVLYRPPVKTTTALLWYGPPALLLVGGVVLVVVLRRRAALPADRFDPDEDDASPDPALPRTTP